MVATKDVQKGTLLLVSKAFATVGAWQSVDALAHAVAEKLKRRPEMAVEISALYDGNPREAGAPAPKGVPDVYRLEKICKNNCFGFDGKGDFNGWEYKGLWIMPSYFNHSCLRNAAHNFNLDVMTVFTIADIKEGEEVTLSYGDPYDAYKQRKELFMNFGFICKCRLCELDRTDARYSQREHMVQDALQARARTYALLGVSGGIDVLTQRLMKIRATYEGRPELKPRLHKPLMILANDYRRSTKKDKHTAQIKVLIECAECLGEGLLTDVGDCLYARLAECYDQEGDEDNARKYARMAVEALRTRSGCDASVLKKMKPKVAEIDHLL
ncbi:TPR domain-containing protein [Aphelenchoides avenae]|nr:TPR domain-containing protein [Aphelenchus avenae]KAH7716351.1 TPR domain-containing protein [Aphelenchus avenae]